MRLAISIFISLVLSLSCSGAALLNSFISFPSGEASWTDQSTPSGSTRNNYNFEVGSAFTVPSSITIKKLGLWVVSGNSSTVTLKLYSCASGFSGSTTGTITLLKSTTLNQSGLSGWQYASITPETVNPGTLYAVQMTVVTSGDYWFDQYTQPVSSAATAVEAAYGVGSTVLWRFGTSAGKMYGGVDFKY